MFNKNSKKSGIEFNHGNESFSAEAAKDLGVDLSDKNNLTTTKILYAYELGLDDRL